MAELRPAALVGAVRADTLHETWSEVAEPLLVAVLKGRYLFPCPFFECVTYCMAGCKSKAHMGYIYVFVRLIYMRSKAVLSSVFL